MKPDTRSSRTSAGFIFIAAASEAAYGKPCRVCGSPVQRIRYANNETSYCARCQTDGKLLADRALSRLLKQDWPKSIDEL